MTTYTVTLTEAELDTVRETLGYKVPARKVAVRTPSPTAKPRTFGAPRLNAKQFDRAVRDWSEAVEKGGDWWRSSLADQTARATNRTAESVERAWGIEA